MTDSDRVHDWARFYEASHPSYRPWALHAIWEEDRATFHAVCKKLGLTLDKLMEEMEE